MAKLGDQLAGTGQRMLKEQVEKEDKLAYAKAKVGVLREAAEVREELQKDPDYETWVPRFETRMTKARGEAAKLIPSRSDRALFEADMELDIARIRGDLQASVFGRRASSEVAGVEEMASTAQDMIQAATDEPTRVATINAIGDAYQGLVDKGYITAEEAGKKKRAFAGSAGELRVQTLKDAGDLVGARTAFEAYRPMFTAEQEIRLNAQLHGAEENRTILTIADEEMALGLPTAPSAPTGQGKWSVISAPGAARDGGKRVHQGYDIAPSEGTPGWYPTQDFRVENPRNGARQGLTADVVFEDGTRLTLMHLASLPAPGSYKAGELAAIAGNTGNAKNTPTHFHVEGVDQAGKRIDPTGFFQTGTGGPATGAPPNVDLGELYDRIDARAKAEGWTPERREKVKDEVARRVKRNEAIDQDRQDEAFERALAEVEALGDDFTDPSQIRAYHDTSETDQLRIRSMAEANRKAKIVAVSANGVDAIGLSLMPYYEPEAFKSMNLIEFTGRVTPAELKGAMVKQAAMRSQPSELEKWNPRSGIVEAFNFGKTINAMDLSKADEAAILQIMEGEARQMFQANGGKPLTENEYQTLFRRATRSEVTRKTVIGIPVGKGSKPRYELDLSTMPDATRDRLTKLLRKNGLPVNDENLLRLYRFGQGQ